MIRVSFALIACVLTLHGMTSVHAAVTLRVVKKAQYDDAQHQVRPIGRSTIERMDSLVNRTLVALARQVQAESISVRIAPHPDSDYMRVKTIDALGQRVIVDSISSSADLLVMPIDVSTRYEATDAADSVDRIISVVFEAVLTEKGSSKILALERLTERERMHRTDALRLQSPQRTSTNAAIPPARTTMWDDILQPAIFVAAAVTTVVLLFTVRSQ